MRRIVVTCPRCGDVIKKDKCPGCGWPEQKLSIHRVRLRRDVREVLARLGIGASDIYTSSTASASEEG